MASNTNTFYVRKIDDCIDKLPPADVLKFDHQSENMPIGNERASMQVLCERYSHQSYPSITKDPFKSGDEVWYCLGPFHTAVRNIFINRSKNVWITPSQYDRLKASTSPIHQILPNYTRGQVHDDSYGKKHSLVTSLENTVEMNKLQKFNLL